MAAFFHDAVYDPPPSTTRSRARARRSRARELGWDGRPDRAVASWSGDARHEATDEPDRAVLLDADLAVLGSEPSAYQAYVAGVRPSTATSTARPGASAARACCGLLTGRLYSTQAARSGWSPGAGEHHGRAGIAAVAQRSGEGRAAQRDGQTCDGRLDTARAASAAQRALRAMTSIGFSVRVFVAAAKGRYVVDLNGVPARPGTEADTTGRGAARPRRAGRAR